MVELPGWPMYDNVDVVKSAKSGRPGRTIGPMATANLAEDGTRDSSRDADFSLPIKVSVSAFAILRKPRIPRAHRVEAFVHYE